jgi:hypothetical protein
MRPKVRALLDQIDSFFITEEAADTRPLWDILTALRGPDNDDEEAKETTTIPIRRAAFPRLSADAQGDGMESRTGAVFTPLLTSGSFALPDRVDHFFLHAKRAWQGCNDTA